MLAVVASPHSYLQADYMGQTQCYKGLLMVPQVRHTTALHSLWTVARYTVMMASVDCHYYTVMAALADYRYYTVLMALVDCRYYMDMMASAGCRYYMDMMVSVDYRYMGLAMTLSLDHTETSRHVVR